MRIMHELQDQVSLTLVRFGEALAWCHTAALELSTMIEANVAENAPTEAEDEESRAEESGENDVQ